MSGESSKIRRAKFRGGQSFEMTGLDRDRIILALGCEAGKLCQRWFAGDETVKPELERIFAKARKLGVDIDADFFK